MCLGLWCIEHFHEKGRPEALSIARTITFSFFDKNQHVHLDALHSNLNRGRDHNALSRNDSIDSTSYISSSYSRVLRETRTPRVNQPRIPS